MTTAGAAVTDPARGWVPSAAEGVEIELGHLVRQDAAYGTKRLDTDYAPDGTAICGDTDQRGALPTRDGAAAHAPGERKAGDPAGGRLLDAAFAMSSNAVSTYSLARVWYRQARLRTATAVYGGRVLPAKAKSEGFGLVPGPCEASDSAGRLYRWQSGGRLLKASQMTIYYVAEKR